MIKAIFGGLAALFFTIGFLLVDRSSTGNVIFEGDPVLKTAPIIGLVLIIFSVLITFYLIKK